MNGEVLQSASQSLTQSFSRSSVSIRPIGQMNDESRRNSTAALHSSSRHLYDPVRRQIVPHYPLLSIRSFSGPVILFVSFLVFFKKATRRFSEGRVKFGVKSRGEHSVLHDKKENPAHASSLVTVVHEYLKAAEEPV